MAIIAVAFVASADMLDFLVKKHAGTEIATIASATPSTTASANLDYSSTASLPKLISRSVLDPCTGLVK